MTCFPRRRHAYVLAELLTVLALSLLLASVLGKLALDAVYLQRVAAEHAHIVATTDSLTRQLRNDALGTIAYTYDTTAIHLDLVDEAGRASVTYVVQPDSVRRLAPHGDERVWSAWRLGFAWRIEPGPRGDVLHIEFQEQPPPRASEVLTRSSSTAIGLPRANGGAD